MIIELDQYKYELGQKEQSLRDLGASLDLDNKKKRIAELDRICLLYTSPSPRD